MRPDDSITVAELFAGVGGFRLGLEGWDGSQGLEALPSAGPFKTIWANQWEPPGTEKKQFAARCYTVHFGADSVVNNDIAATLDAYERGEISIPDVRMLVGGFPCQDYSVAKPLSMAGGIEGKKGVLWWSIYRFLRLKKPQFVLLENVDRLLKSPVAQRGRDFAIILSCFAQLGYQVEWRVVNSGAYGFSQRRKRTYIYAELTEKTWDLEERLQTGVMTSAFPVSGTTGVSHVDIPTDPYKATATFNVSGSKLSPFRDMGVMSNYVAATCPVEPLYEGPTGTLGSVLVPEEEVPTGYYVDESKLSKWEYCKGSKREPRTTAAGFAYEYAEGSMAFPDALDRPSRTILTSEGGSGPSRTKHIIQAPNGRMRRLVPDELDRLQGFPKGWTNTGMSDGNRAFCMGNALVVGVVNRIGQAIAREQGLSRQA
jgi:DNA (cytosine-5)-methyltransferase 1